MVWERISQRRQDAVISSGRFIVEYVRASAWEGAHTQVIFVEAGSGTHSTLGQFPNSTEAKQFCEQQAAEWTGATA